MFQLMYDAKGIGLAANQVNLPIRMFVVNVLSDPEQGQEMVFINPVVSRPKGFAEEQEGCLSLPGVYGDVKRPKQIHVSAYTLEGKPIDATVDGLLARVIQHELDHLDGVMFPDRMSESGRLELRGVLDEFETDYQSRQRTGEVPSDDEVQSHLKAWEERYC